MCWTANIPSHKEPLIADKDINVKKVVLKRSGDTINSVYMDCKYKLGEVMEVDEMICEYYSQNLCVYEGLHSYHEDTVIYLTLSLMPTLYVFSGISGRKLDYLYSGFGGRKVDYLYDCSRPYSYYMEMHCIIPKGSTYYVNEHGEYVSNKLLPVELKEVEVRD